MMVGVKSHLSQPLAQNLYCSFCGQAREALGAAVQVQVKMLSDNPNDLHQSSNQVTALSLPYQQCRSLAHLPLKHLLCHSAGEHSQAHLAAGTNRIDKFYLNSTPGKTLAGNDNINPAETTATRIFPNCPSFYQHIHLK